ncbi:hypothetical protein [Oceanithermus sp.]
MDYWRIAEVVATCIMAAATIGLVFFAVWQAKAIKEQLRASTLPKISTRLRRVGERIELDVYNVDGVPMHLLCVWSAEWDGITRLSSAAKRRLGGRCGFVGNDVGRQIFTGCAPAPVTVNPGEKATVACCFDGCEWRNGSGFVAIDLAYQRSSSRFVRLIVPIFIDKNGNPRPLRKMVHFDFIEALIE